MLVVFLENFTHKPLDIWKTNTNLYATNNVFQLLPRAPSYNLGGRGIHLINQNLGTDEYSLEVDGDNRFYDCVVGIEADGYTKINISETDMRSTQMPDTSIPHKGDIGILVTTPYLDAMNIWENTITNVRNGIVFLAEVLGSAPTYYGQKIGPVNIYENIIQATLDGNSGSPTDEYVLNGIIADNVLWYERILDTVWAPIDIYDNKLYQVHNGIHTQGWLFFEFADNVGWLNKVQTMDNYISLRQIGYPDSTEQSQFGIQHNMSWGGEIINNTVQGFGNADSVWYGIIANDLYVQYLPLAQCNTTTETGTGFLFNIPSNDYSFESNLMDNNGFGYVLNGGDIGTQGGSNYASMNLWTNFTGGNFKTFTDGGSDPNNSILWIDTMVLDQYPQFAFNGTSGFPTDRFDISNGLEDVTSNSNSTSCSPPQGRLVQNSNSQALNNGSNARSGNSTNNIDTFRLIDLVEQLVTDSFSLSPFPDAGRAMAQQRAYRMLELHHGLGNHSPILQNFHINAHTSNIRRLARIEEALSRNHLQQAQQLLTVLNPNDIVENNAKAFFTAYLHIKQNTFSIQDSLELHRLVRGCTARDGFAVPQARALYRLKFKDFTNFFDDCGNSIAYRPVNVDNTKNIDSVGIILYPNPTTGEVWLKTKETGEAEVSVYNLEGKLLYRQNIKNISEENKLNLDFINGLYLVSVRTEKQYYIAKLTIIR